MNNLKAGNEIQAPPLMRGWLHLGTSPVALIAGFILVIVTPTLSMRFTIALFTLASALLFTVSATYHRINWSPKWKAIFRRLDHANIFLIIAATYTPLTIYWLAGDQAQTLLLLVWLGSLAGLFIRIFWIKAPRWLYVPIYVALGWAAIFYLPSFLDSAGALIVSLIFAGGVAYSVGAIIYGVKKPNFSKKYFGFHELFHAFTIAGYLCHYLAITFTVVAMY
ncbi:MAG: hemolysin III family protein [Candidatus Nanopelagicales bacterium]